jgi:hypothetical protein
MAKRANPVQPLPAHPGSRLAQLGRLSSIPASTCPNLCTKRYARPPLRSGAKSTILLWKGSDWRSESEVIPRLTLSRQQAGSDD